MAIKYVTAALGAVGAGATSAQIPVPTNGDDSTSRRVVGVKCTNTTKAIRLQLLNNGQPMTDTDLAVLGQLTSFLPVDFTVAANIQFQIVVVNGSGGALAAGDFAVIEYTV